MAGLQDGDRWAKHKPIMREAARRARNEMRRDGFGNNKDAHLHLLNSMALEVAGALAGLHGL